MTLATGTGTPATQPFFVTAQELLDEIRLALDDVNGVEFSDEVLLSFLNEAVREYSQYFGRISRDIVPMISGKIFYPLVWDAIAVIAVLYQSGNQTPERLLRRTRRDPLFRGSRVYDVIWPHDQTAPPMLMLGFEPADGATLTVSCRRPHDFMLFGGDKLTVPAEHHHVLLQYVLFAAARRLQNREQVVRTNSSSLLMAQLAANTRRLELAWLNALNRILTQRLGEGEIVSWSFP